ncbi:MAG: hypothetical protein AVDCRST_MAG93-3948 [uncultured Chloroflexia bacterium]|uniref:Uncharacterized protein n=1 Tax=uncultured Chloroflexia bacterium TaxID=1672391 RepID=A0A6J4JZT8_9CHLR|nr:MAG: hypothetical protein AVDCRST_MAG93-3948 [uncultured Chloroflexia bacterium]
MDSCEEVAGGFVITGSDGAEMLELKGKGFDEVPIFIPLGVIGAGGEPVGFRRNDGSDAFVFKQCQNARVGIVGFIGKELANLKLG